MKALRTIIIDDEKHQRENIRMILNNHCSGIEVVAEGGSALEGMALLVKHNPDVIFLDVEMPGGTGFDLLNSIEILAAEVIFITAYGNHMQKAFKVNAFDYLVKPIDIEELITTVNRLKASKNRMNDAGHKISLPSSNGIIYIEKEDILYVRAQGSYAEVKLNSGKIILVSKNLKYIEALLPKEIFMRIHRSTLININEVKEFSRSEGGIVILDSGEGFNVSADCKDELLSRLADL